MPTLRFAIAASLAVTTAAAQDFIHYKFDSPCFNEVINYATGPQAFPGNGLLETNSASSPWTSGVYGGALAGGASVTPTFYNRVRTGWNPSTQPLTGDVTIAWSMRERNSPGTTLTYIMGAPSGGIRLFTNGVAGRALVQREILASGGNIAARDFQLPATVTDVQTLAAAGWVHIAIVVDGTAGTADWYVNGTSVLQLTGTGPANMVLNGPFTVGYYSSPSPYDIDEFLISTRAYSGPEILALAFAAKAGAGPFLSDTTTQCGSLGLASVGGAPSLGNANFGLEIQTSATSLFFVFLGVDRCTFGGVLPLPLDGSLLTPIATGCQILTNFDIQFTGITAGAPAVLGMPIPNLGIYSGLSLYAQAATLDFGTSAVSASNGVSMSLGF